LFQTLVGVISTVTHCIASGKQDIVGYGVVQLVGEEEKVCESENMLSHSEKRLLS